MTEKKQATGAVGYFHYHGQLKHVPLEDTSLTVQQTMDLRVLRRGGDRVLQQKWQAMDGTVEWRDVPEVEA